MGSQVLLRLESLEKRNKLNNEAINNDLYKRVYSKELLSLSYNLIKSKPGNMPLGTNKLTLDTVSHELVERMIMELRKQTYKFKPVKHVDIPKGNKGKTRTLGVPPLRDKIVQKAMLLVLESIYEPIFSQHSHGFRPRLSCHSALKEMKVGWTDIKWGVEGNIVGYYDSINHHKLISLLRKKISDEKFIQLVWKLLRTGVERNGLVEGTNVGTPQGGILSPLLANIYLHEFDEYLLEMSNEISCLSNKSRRENPEYKKISSKLCRLRTMRSIIGVKKIKPSKEALLKIRELQKLQRKTPSKDSFDKSYRKVIFIRYANDWIIGVIGNKMFAEEILHKVKNFLTEHLKLGLSKEKAKVTLMSSKHAFFLGYTLQIVRTSHFSSTRKDHKQTVGWRPRMLVPMEKIISKLFNLNFCTSDGTGVKKKGWIFYPDEIIVDKYNYVIRGLRNYYSPADNYSTSVNRIEYILKYSCAHTLAAKHRSRVSQQLIKLEDLGLSLSKSYKNNIWDFKTKSFEHDGIFLS